MRDDRESKQKQIRDGKMGMDEGNQGERNRITRMLKQEKNRRMDGKKGDVSGVRGE